MQNNKPLITEEMEMKMPEGYEHIHEKPSYLGIFIGIMIILLVVVLGGLYMWSTYIVEQNNPSQAVRPTDEENNEPESNKAEADTSNASVVSTSDDLGAIEADLDSTQLFEFDADLNAIEAELDEGEVQAEE